jgi:hypothetical protein
LVSNGPERVLRELAAARSRGTTNFSGVHLFCFGGYLRTCEWLHRAASGHLAVETYD